jgi:hypothetical protein
MRPLIIFLLQNLEFSAHVRMQSDAFAKLCSKFNVIGSTGFIALPKTQFH